MNSIVNIIKSHLLKQKLNLNYTCSKQRLYLAPPFLVWDYNPIALSTLQSNQMDEKITEALNELKDCKVCPRNCGVNRLEDKMGICNTGRKAIVSSCFPHFGEESVLQGYNGSGTIFFGMCNMRCVFCQNWDISQKKNGWELDGHEIADLMLKLQNETKCHNINFVTPEHVVPQVVEAISVAVKNGLKLPIVYNTSSYDSLKSLQLMEGLVDIYMPDFKFWTPETSQNLCKARDYPAVTKAAIKEMHRQVGDLVFNEEGIAQKGLIVRHLVMPGYVEEGKEILKWISEELSKDTYVNVMTQYMPSFKVGKGEKRARGGFTDYEEINRPIRISEFDELKEYAKQELGLWRFEDESSPPCSNYLSSL